MQILSIQERLRVNRKLAQRKELHQLHDHVVLAILFCRYSFCLNHVMLLRTKPLGLQIVRELYHRPYCYEAIGSFQDDAAQVQLELPLAKLVPEYPQL